MNAQTLTPEHMLRSALAWWEDCGVDIPAAQPAARAGKSAPAGQASAKRSLPPIDPPKRAAKAQASAAVSDFAPLIAKARAMAGAVPTLGALKAAVENFDAGDLSANARRAVFARGNPDAKIMVIGESPGKEEDAAGQPFIGPAGQLLDKMLGAIGLDETSVYITNVCNWRPLNNRSPNPDELALCAPIIARHIELAAPDMILMMGGVSLEALCGIKGIMKSHGQWQSIKAAERDIPALPIYHPAFLLRRPELKRDAWRDLLAVKARLAG